MDLQLLIKIPKTTTKGGGHWPLLAPCFKKHINQMISNFKRPKEAYMKELVSRWVNELTVQTCN